MFYSNQSHNNTDMPICELKGLLVSVITFCTFQCKLQGPANTNSFFFTTLQDRFELSYLSLCIVRISHVLITKWCYSRGQQAESSSCWLLW